MVRSLIMGSFSPLQICDGLILSVMPCVCRSDLISSFMNTTWVNPTLTPQFYDATKVTEKEPIQDHKVTWNAFPKKVRPLSPTQTFIFSQGLALLTRSKPSPAVITNLGGRLQMLLETTRTNIANGAYLILFKDII